MTIQKLDFRWEWAFLGHLGCAVRQVEIFLNIFLEYLNFEGVVFKFLLAKITQNENFT